MSKRYKIVLFVRFLGYFTFIAGIAGFFFIFGPLVQVELSYRLDKFRGIQRTIAEAPSPSQEPGTDLAVSETPSGGTNFGTLGNPSENTIIPVDTEYGIVIEKINANAKIIPGVDPANEREYVDALRFGVAEALGSTPPGQPGNLYLFSHSTDAPWNIVRYNAIFYLLRELQIGDRVIIFHKNRRYDYIVFDKVIAKPTEVSYLTNRYDDPVLTLQTCDPPGTLLNRLVIRAKLASS